MALPTVQQATLRRDEQHRYFVGDTRIRGVNETIEALIAKSEWVEEWYRDRGSLGHEAIALALCDDLDWDTLDEELAPFVRAALAFMADTGWKPELVQEQLYSPTLWVAGEPDLVAFEPGRKPKRHLIDWKLGGHIAPYRLQTAGYAVILEDNGVHVDQRLCVLLQRDGKYRVRAHRNASDRTAFIGLCHALGWKEIHVGSSDD